MPVYEYEPLEEGRDCPQCRRRFSWLQGITEPALDQCPQCGGGIKRVVSRAQIRTKGEFSYEKAAKHGLTTFKRAGEGQWEKVAGEGVDGIVGSQADIASIKQEKSKVYDLDNP